jgi:DnaK suppressor protein
MKKEIKLLKKELLKTKSEIIKRNRTPEDVDVSGDEFDFIQGVSIVEMSNQLSKRDLNNFNQIQIALDKIEDGSFGICVDCGEEISLRRLQANPYSCLCILCAEAKERN